MDHRKAKSHAHELIEQLPDSQLAAAVRFLEFMLLDPLARAAASAAPDDEPLTAQDRRRLRKAGLGSNSAAARAFRCRTSLLSLA
jgi:hypothetical protein